MITKHIFAISTYIKQHKKNKFSRPWARSPLTLLATCLMLGILFITGCQIGAGDHEGGEVHLLVTANFGQETVFDERVDVQPGENINSVMERHMEVEYAYGGGFINSIEGIRSGYTGEGERGEKKDWFLYVNGILSEAAAGSHLPEEGDVVWWDYHSWDDVFFVPAVVGSFPQPFVNGYRGDHPGAQILHGKGAEEPSEKLGAYLEEEGLSEELKISPYEQSAAENRSRMTLVVALWEELADSDYWQGLQDNRSRTGWFVEFEEEEITPLHMDGTRPETGEEAAGAVLATGSGMGDKNPLWLVTARDSESLQLLVEKVVSSPQKLSGKAGVVLIEDELWEIPWLAE